MYWQMFKLALRRPGVVPALVGLAWAARRRGWYRRAPFLPVPPRSYLAWRLDTAYGDPVARPPAHEAERYVRWTRQMRRLR